MFVVVAAAGAEPVTEAVALRQGDANESVVGEMAGRRTRGGGDRAVDDRAVAEYVEVDDVVTNAQDATVLDGDAVGVRCSSAVVRAIAAATASATGMASWRCRAAVMWVPRQRT
ncbi:MAG: hypothetical protein AB7H43_13695 [Acidimicrobiia bacterium]